MATLLTAGARHSPALQSAPPGATPQFVSGRSGAVLGGRRVQPLGLSILIFIRRLPCNLLGLPRFLLCSRLCGGLELELSCLLLGLASGRSALAKQFGIITVWLAGISWRGLYRWLRCSRFSSRCDDYLRLRSGLQLGFSNRLSDILALNVGALLAHFDIHSSFARTAGAKRADRLALQRDLFRRA